MPLKSSINLSIKPVIGALKVKTTTIQAFPNIKKKFPGMRIETYSSSQREYYTQKSKCTSIISEYLQR